MIHQSALPSSPTIDDVCCMAASMLDIRGDLSSPLARRDVRLKMHNLGWTLEGKHITPDWTKPTDTAIEMSFARVVKPRASYIVATAFADVEHEGLVCAVAVISALSVPTTMYLPCDPAAAARIGLGWAGVPSHLYTVVDVDRRGHVSATLIMDEPNGVVVDMDLLDLAFAHRRALCA